MNFKLYKSDFLRGVASVMPAVGRKAVMPILETVMVEVENGNVRFTGNDLELCISSVTNANIGSVDGKCCVEADMLFKIAQKLPDGDVSFDTDGTRAVIKCGSSKFTLSARDAKDFVVPKKGEPVGTVTIKCETLRTLIDGTAFCTAPGDTNRMMTVINLKQSDGKLQAEGLDGHRVAKRMAEAASDTEFEMNIPASSAKAISKMLPDSGDVTVTLTDNHCFFETPEISVDTRLIEGQYFKIDHMFNSEPLTTLKINRRALMDSADRAKVVMGGENRKPLILNIKKGDGGGFVDVSMRTETGELDEEISADVRGEDLEIGFNPNFLTDMLAHADGDEAEIGFGDYRSPAVMKTDEYAFLILPVNIKSN